MNGAIAKFEGTQVAAAACPQQSAESIRYGFSLALVLGIRTGEECNAEGVDPVMDWSAAAYELGAIAGPDADVPEVFKGTMLEADWKAGRQQATDETQATYVCH